MVGEFVLTHTPDEIALTFFECKRGLLWCCVLCKKWKIEDAASLIKEENQIADPNIVKVVVAQSGNALYFSRSPIPFVREPGRAPHHRHIGIYGYRADFLQTFIKLPPSPLEESESLEQLRALDNGARIHVVMTDHEAIGLDTPEQVSLLERLLKPDSDQQTP